MDAELLRLLLQADHPSACENPPDFDWKGEIERVRALQPAVESIVGRRFEINESVQDASFLTDLATFIDEPQPAGGILRHTALALRFLPSADCSPSGLPAARTTTSIQKLCNGS